MHADILYFIQHAGMDDWKAVLGDACSTSKTAPPDLARHVREHPEINDAEQLKQAVEEGVRP